MNIQKLKGTQDILPEEIGRWRDIEDISRRIFSNYAYREIRTPIIEEAGLFVRSVGKDTDIVKKQMYSFKNQGGRDIALRPEETAPVVRAYLENNLDKTQGFVKLFYMGPMFRSERPQAGRFRQFSQVGIEAIGSYSPYLDAEVIILLDELLKGYGLKNYAFKINSLGCEKDKKKIKDILKKELKYSLNSLCKDCQRRYKTNILRILDCKSSACKKIAKAVSLKGALCKECSDDFILIQKLLDKAKVRYEITPILVRGLDYYTKTIFEVAAEGLGAQDAIAAGGRYDNLVSDLGGDKTGACGFAIGIERVIEVLSKVPKPTLKEKELIFIVTIGDEAYEEGFKILSELRRSGLSADIDYQQKSLKAQMRYANKIGASYVIVLGEDELKSKKVNIKDMKDSSQRSVAIKDLKDAFNKKD